MKCIQVASVCLAFLFGCTPTATRAIVPETSHSLSSSEQESSLLMSDYDLAQALKSEDWKQRRRAIESINDENVLFKIALSDVSSAVRDAAVRRISNRVLLTRIAKSKRNPSFRPYFGAQETALARLTDPQILLDVARTAARVGIREDAVRKIDDQKLLAELAFSESVHRVQKAAVEGLVDRESLIKAALTFNGYIVEWAPTPRGGRRDVSLAEVAMNKLQDKEAIAQVAQRTRNKSVGQAAVARISDQMILLELVLHAKSFHVRRNALKQLDVDRLHILLNEPDISEALQIATRVQLTETSWPDIVLQARSDDDFVELAIQAISYADRQNNLTHEITQLCRKCIRRGTYYMIPTLRLILETHGTVELATDYLNCGQPALASSASTWASRNGYRIRSLPGSIRARWGQ